LGESGGVGCSSGLIERCVSGSLCSCLSGITTCHGESCRFPVLGKGCDPFQDGPFSWVNSSCFSNKGVIRIGAGRGRLDEDASWDEGSVTGESSFHFPMTGDGWNSSHSGGVGLSLDNVLESGCLGNGGLMGASVIETMGGSSNDDATGGDGCGVFLGKGGTSHGRGMRSSEEGVVHLTGGNGMFSVGWVTGIDVGNDRGRGILTGSGVSSIGTGVLRSWALGPHFSFFSRPLCTYTIT